MPLLMMVNQAVLSPERMVPIQYSLFLMVRKYIILVLSIQEAWHHLQKILFL